MTTRFLCLLAAMTAGPAAAHDFWVEAAPYSVAVGSPVSVLLYVGHGTNRQRWGANLSRVVRFTDLAATGSVDRRAALHTDSGSDDATLTFATPGTHILIFESTHAKSVLPAIRFDDYAKTEGLTPAIERRAGKPASDGRELYSRRAKALVQVVGRAGPQPHVTKPVGLTLEIVPQRNPYDLQASTKLPVRVYYEGRPLVGATIKLNNLDFDTRPIAILRTDNTGSATFDVPRRGRWQFNVVWTKAISGNPEADFETIFSSLSFGYDKLGG